MNKNTITYYVSQSKDAGYDYELTAQKNNGERELCNRWPVSETNTQNDRLRLAIGLGTIKAVQSKNDYGNKARLVIEVPICSIDDPMITI